MTRPAQESRAREVVHRWGPDQSRMADAADALDDRRPTALLEPTDLTALGAMLHWANTDRQPILVQGAGTKLDWGGGRGVSDVILSTARLDRPIEHCAGDLTVTAGAGARLGAVNEILARERQRLPLDPRHSDRCTIGGVIAANDSGPRRHQYGTPRDLIIGIEMALSDGRRAKAGGRVVKNVAGYDLARLLCGSFGSLAIITSATFKLAPAPPASRTVIAGPAQTRPLAELALAIAASPLTPAALEIETLPSRLLIRFESTESAADRQAAMAQQLCSARSLPTSLVASDAEMKLWQAHEDAFNEPGATLVKIAVLPGQVADVIELVERVALRFGLAWRLGGRAALGVLYLRLTSDHAETADADTGADEARHANAVEELRRNARARGGSAVIVSAASGVIDRVGAWGDVGDGWPLMRALKSRFDPHAILNPGRGPGGL
jgi:glycolate oxidase FAD binding subunit